jgi:sugar transferase (PEP-CTERM/EpsH1 system associated)
MRILMLTPQLPYPPRQGTALRNWGILSHLARERQHEVWLLSFDEPREAQASGSPIAPELQAACAQIAVFAPPPRTPRTRLRTLLTSPLPDMAWRLWSPEAAAKYRAWASENRFDIIQVEGIELARYALDAGAGVAAPFVFDDHNCEYLLQRRAFETDARQPRRWHAAAYSLVQWQRLRAFERRAARAAAATLTVSAQDAAALRDLDARLSPHVIPNGIDVAGYADFAAPARPSANAAPTLVFTGKMDFRPNVDAMLWFGREVFPLIQQAVPEVRLVIMGQRPSPRLDVLRAQRGVTLTGEVPDQRPYIAQADVYIAPLRVGGGTRFKLLEAMAMRRPIVSTTLGCEGFDVQHGRELMIGDSPAGFAEAVLQVLHDPALRAGLVQHAYDFVRRRYDWGVIVPQLERVYQTISPQR